MSRYAAQTEVSVEKSKGEIERILSRYGATAFMYGWDGMRALVQFKAKDRYVRFLLPMPDRNDFRRTPGGRRSRSEADVDKAWEQAQRQTWRALKLVIQAKLEAVEAGITTFEDEFMAHIVLPNQQTVGDWLRPQIEEAYRTNELPSMLPALGPGK